MAISGKKKLGLTSAVLVSVFIFFIIGQYAGGAYFLDSTLISLDYLTYDTLYNNSIKYINDDSFTQVLQIGLLISFVVTMFPIGIAIMFFYIFLEQEEIHGSARWANDKELAASGLFPTDKQRKTPSILLGKMTTGKFAGKYVELVGQLFAGVGAPTRSGKGVSIVIPNLVTFTDSVIVLDLKLENFIKTGGFRQKYNHEVFLFCPSGYNPDYKYDSEDLDGSKEAKDLRSHRWNPFDYVRRHDAFRVGDILVMTNSLYPLTGDKNDIWNELAGKLFKGLALWMLDTEKLKNVTPTLPYILELTAPDGGLVKWMKNEISLGYLSKETILEFNNFIEAPDETRGSILSNLVSPLAIFSDKVVAASVSGSDFNFRDLRRKKTAIYIGIAPKTLGKFKKLINLFFEQAISENISVLPEQDPSLKYQCLMVMDEFTAIGRVQQISHSISFTAGYNVRFLIIYQSNEQLEDKKAYDVSGAGNILKNLAARVVFPPKEVDDSVKRLSDTLGTKTVKVKSDSRSKGKGISTSANTSKQKRPLMMPHEIIELGTILHKTAPLGIKTILIKENQRPFIMDKIFYFDEPILLERVNYSINNTPEVPLLSL